MTPHLSTLALHRLRYGEITGAEREEATAHLDVCARCQARLAVQERERSAFVLEPVPAALRGSSVLRRVREHGLPRILVPVAVAAMAAGAIGVALPALRSDDPEVETEGNRILYRGFLPAIEAWVDEGEGPHPLRPGESLAEGDRVQLRYDAQGAEHVALAGRDSSGVVEIYTLSAPGGTGLQTAPFALELDDSTGEQELFVVTSDTPLDEGVVYDALAGATPQGVTVSRIAFPKRSGP
jgi:hypothetical protein